MKNKSNTFNTLTTACFKGDVKSVNQLTSELLKIDDLNTKSCSDLIKSACLAGQKEVCEFLFNHTHPFFKHVTHRAEYVNSFIEVVLDKEHASLLKNIQYLRPELYSNYLSSMLSVEKINEYLVKFAMSGNADITQVFHESLPAEVVLKPFEFLKQAMVIDRVDVFEYWVNSVKLSDLEKNPDELSSIIRKGFGNQSFQSLKALGKKIPFTHYIELDTFIYSITVKNDNLNFLFENFDYLPSPELMAGFKKFLNEPKRYSYYEQYKVWDQTLNRLESRIEINNEKNLLNSITINTSKNAIKNKI